MPSLSEFRNPSMSKKDSTAAELYGAVATGHRYNHNLLFLLDDIIAYGKFQLLTPLQRQGTHLPGIRALQTTMVTRRKKSQKKER